jgi:hypothetical protein
MKNEKKTYVDKTSVINPKVVKTVVSGADLYFAAWCRKAQVYLHRGRTEEVTLLILKAPLPPSEDGVKQYLQYVVEDIDGLAAKAIKMFSKVSIGGVATGIRETFEVKAGGEQKLAFRTYGLKTAKIEVAPCEDREIAEFDEPIAGFMRAPEQAKSVTHTADDDE